MVSLVYVEDRVSVADVYVSHSTLIVTTAVTEFPPWIVPLTLNTKVSRVLIGY